MVAEPAFDIDCFTYQTVRCYICGGVTVPDDQCVQLRGKKYVCICLPCALAVRVKYDYSN